MFPGGGGKKKKNNSNDSLIDIVMMFADGDELNEALGSNSVSSTPKVVNEVVSMMLVLGLLLRHQILGSRVRMLIKLKSIRAISERFANTAYGFFLEKRVAYPVIANYVRNTSGYTVWFDQCLARLLGAGETKNLKKPSQMPKEENIEPTKEVSKENSFDMLNLVENDVELGTNGGTSHLARQTIVDLCSGLWILVILVLLLLLKKLIIDRKVTLVDNEERPLKKVDDDSEDEIASVDNEMASFLAKKDSYDNAAKDDNPKFYPACCRIMRTRTSRRTSRGCSRTGGRSSNQGNSRIDGQGGQVAQAGNQGGNGNQNRNVGNDNIQSNVRNVMVNNNRVGYTYKEFLAYNPNEYDGKGSVVVYTRRKVVVGMLWDDFKVLMKEEFCPSNEMQKLETELWNHAMVGTGHAAYTDRFHELVRLVPHLVTPKSHFVKDCRVVPKNVNPINARNPTAMACYECGCTDHFKTACLRLNQVQRPRETIKIKLWLLMRVKVMETKRISQGIGHLCWEQSFDVIIRIDWLSDHKAKIICHEKVVRIPLLDGKGVRVLGEKPKEKVFLDDLSRLPPVQEIKFRIELVPEAMPIAKSPYRLSPFELKELLSQLKELQEKAFIQPSSSPCKVNAVADALSRKKRVKPKRVRVMNMILQSSIKDKILVAQKETFNESMGLQRGLDEMVELRRDEALYYLDRIWVHLKRDMRTLIVDEAHKLKYYLHLGVDKMYYDLRDMYWWLVNAKGIRNPVRHEYGLPPSHKWSDVAWKVVVRFGKKGKLAPRFVGPFEITKWIGLVSYGLRLPEEFNGGHDTFYVSNLKKCLADPTLQVPVDEIQVDVKLNFIEEPVEILEREFRKLK
nr:reverse transcriptase domain-containing protein [Tanacetum cinerariifolium]